MVTSKQIALFRARVAYSDGGCWIHSGSRGSHGYAQFGSPRAAWGGLAHRFAWIEANGPIPEGMFILHSCNVKTCVNPAHLRAGTNDENMDDVARGRHHPRRKLTTEQVEAVRDALAQGHPMRPLAKSLGVHEKTVALIRDRVTYRYG